MKKIKYTYLLDLGFYGINAYIYTSLKKKKIDICSKVFSLLYICQDIYTQLSALKMRRKKDKTRKNRKLTLKVVRRT